MQKGYQSLESLTKLAYRLDPVQMARGAGLELDPWQAKLVRSQAKRVLVNCSRQTGKSTTTAVLADHTAFYNPGATVLLLSPSLRQSSLLFRKCLQIYQSLGKPVAPESESALRLQLENGSQIVSLPGKEGTVRGFSAVDLLVIDEASRVEESLYISVRPMLAVSGGRLVTLSTPFGTRGWWYETYRNRDQWEYYQITAHDCPRISEAFLEEEKENMGEFWYNQEYLCMFQDSASSAFRSEDIDQIVKKDIETWTL